MKTRLLIITGIMLVGITILPVNAQYTGDKISKENELGEYIGGPGMHPEQQLAQRIENDQNNAVLILVMGIPFLGMVGFLLWRKRK